MSKVITSRVDDVIAGIVAAYAEENGLSISKAAAHLLGLGVREWRLARQGPWNAITTVVLPTGSGDQS